MKKYKVVVWWCIDIESFVLVVMWWSDIGIVCELFCGGFILKYLCLLCELLLYIGCGFL